MDPKVDLHDTGDKITLYRRWINERNKVTANQIS